MKTNQGKWEDMLKKELEGEEPAGGNGDDDEVFEKKIYLPAAAVKPRKCGMKRLQSKRFSMPNTRVPFTTDCCQVDVSSRRHSLPNEKTNPQWELTAEDYECVGLFDGELNESQFYHLLENDDEPLLFLFNTDEKQTATTTALANDLADGILETVYNEIKGEAVAADKIEIANETLPTTTEPVVVASSGNNNGELAAGEETVVVSAENLNLEKELAEEEEEESSTDEQNTVKMKKKSKSTSCKEEMNGQKKSSDDNDDRDGTGGVGGAGGANAAEGSGNGDDAKKKTTDSTAADSSHQTSQTSPPSEGDGKCGEQNADGQPISAADPKLWLEQQQQQQVNSGFLLRKYYSYPILTTGIGRSEYLSNVGILMIGSTPLLLSSPANESQNNDDDDDDEQELETAQAAEAVIRIEEPLKSNVPAAITSPDQDQSIVATPASEKENKTEFDYAESQRKFASNVKLLDKVRMSFLFLDYS